MAGVVLNGKENVDCEKSLFTVDSIGTKWKVGYTNHQVYMKEIGIMNPPGVGVTV